MDNDEADSVAGRELAWLDRERALDDEAWRPPRVQRLATKAWLVRTDAQLRHMTAYAGWQHFIFKDGQASWLDPWHWPQVIMPTDLGSDNVCAISALLNGFDANVWHIPDWSHVFKSTWEAVIKSVKLWDLIILCLIVTNMEYGPYDDESRRGLLNKATAWHYNNRSPASCPLFREMSDALLDDARRHNWFEIVHGQDPEETLWQWQKHRQRTPLPGRRVSLCRFGAGHVSLQRLLECWSLALFERTLLGLDTDLLHGAAVRNKLSTRFARATKPTSDGQDVKTGVRALSIDNKALRDNCANAILTSILVLMQQDNQRAIRCIVEAGRPTHELDKLLNKEFRNLDNTETTAICLGTGSAYKHCVDHLFRTMSLSFLTRCGFQIPDPGAPYGEALSQNNPDEFEGLLVEEDELASLVSRLCVGFCTETMWRVMWIIASWPASMLQILGTEAQAQACVARFKEDLRRFNDRRARYDELTNEEKQLVDRPQFNTRPVRQLVAVLNSENWEITQRLKDFLQQRTRTLWTERPCEDLGAVGETRSL